jgi:DNA polymerase III delta subunit
MIVLLYGADAYRRDARRAFYEREFAKKYGVRPEALDLAEAETYALANAAGERSLFSPRKLIVLSNPYELEPKKLKPLLEPFLESKDLHLLIVAPKKPVKALEVLLKAPVKAEEFDHLEGAAWAKFAKEEAQKRNVKLSEPALKLLLEAYEGNSWGLITELEKLANAPALLEPEDLFSMGLEIAADSFPLIQGLKSSSPAGRLKALATLFAMHEPGAKIFNILAALWPQNAPRFAAYDKEIKFGRMDYEEALTDLAAH